jgi:acyl-CoA dehydrogenase
LGYLQASIPEEYGGFGERSAVSGVLAAEEMAWGDLAAALAVMTPGLFAIPVLMVGSVEQKVAYLPPIVEAEWVPYSAALIEPYFDFDPGDLHTTAEITGSGFRLDGVKTYVPYAPDARAMIVYANLDGRTQGFIVPKDSEGLEIRERMKLLGIYAYPVYEVRIDGVIVPGENRLGGLEGHDFMPILDASRIALASMAVGMSRAAFEYSRDYAKEREVFGVKVAQKQAIAFMLAEMATEIEAIRLLVWEAAWMLDNAMPDASKQSFLALTGAVDMAMMVTDRVVQILGGYGYIREYPAERWMRNGRGIAMLNGLAIV